MRKCKFDISIKELNYISCFQFFLICMHQMNNFVFRVYVYFDGILVIFGEPHRSLLKTLKFQILSIECRPKSMKQLNCKFILLKCAEKNYATIDTMVNVPWAKSNQSIWQRNACNKIYLLAEAREFNKGKERRIDFSHFDEEWRFIFNFYLSIL